MPLDSLPVSTPVGSPSTKHALVAASLADAIERGEYAIGATLPSEPELTLRYGVSRHTVRAALRTLQDRGLVTSQQGVGSTVRARQTGSRYAQAFGSIDDLLQYTSTTQLRMIVRETFDADAAFAEWMGCKAGERWLRLYMTRHANDDGRAVTAVDVFVPHAFAHALHDVDTTRMAIFKLVEQRIGEPIVEVRQEIAAILPTAAEAERLAISPDRPVLAIVRRYFGRRGQVLEATRTVHGDDFRYAMNVRLESARIA